MRSVIYILMIALYLSACASQPEDFNPTEPTLQSLFEAVKADNLPSVRKLLASNTDTRWSETSYRTTVLCMACRHGSAEIVRLLVENGADVNCSDHGATPLVLALKYRHKAIARYLISQGSDINSGSVFSGKAVIHYAVESGEVELVQFLIDKGVNLERRDSEGKIPLHYAVSAVRHDKSMVELLIKKGCNINAVDANGNTPVDYAHLWQIEKLLRNHGGLSGVELCQAKEEGKQGK